MKLEYFINRPTDQYAILSHTWGDEELTFESLGTELSQTRKGFWKVLQCCKQAKSDGLEYAWVDTCCIDKRSSAELSEAINSMFSWYRGAKICYVYLSDVSRPPGWSQRREFSATDEIFTKFICSKWFTRGWTLQELLAPMSLTFYDSRWQILGIKDDLYLPTAYASNIDANILEYNWDFDKCSVAQRMSWASERVTTRLEDSAYCLMGIFDVNMPLLYGEGIKAFRRLQEMILQSSHDESIFAWSGVPTKGSGLLAPTPAHFKSSGNIKWSRREEERPPYAMTSRGLAIQCILNPIAANTYEVALSCYETVEPDTYRSLSIMLGRTVIPSLYRRISLEETDLLETPEGSVWPKSVSQGELLYISDDENFRIPLLPRVDRQILHFSWIQGWEGEAQASGGVRRYVCDDVSTVSMEQIAMRRVKVRKISRIQAEPGAGWSQFHPLAAAPTKPQSLERGSTIIFLDHSRPNPIRAIKIGFNDTLHPSCLVKASRYSSESQEEFEAMLLMDHGPRNHKDRSTKAITTLRAFSKPIDWPVKDHHILPVVRHISSDSVIDKIEGGLGGFVAYFVEGAQTTALREDYVIARLSMYPRQPEWDGRVGGTEWNVEFAERRPSPRIPAVDGATISGITMITDEENDENCVGEMRITPGKTKSRIHMYGPSEL